MQLYTILMTNLLGKEGEVFSAQHLPTNTIRAIKIPKKREAPQLNQPRYRSLAKEAGYLTNLDHPNILKGYELIKTSENSNSFLVTELCNGGNLSNRIKDHPIGHQEHIVKSIALQILSALEYLSSKLIAHKDLKPNNILLSHPDSFDSLKLIDFGMAEQRREGEMLHITSGTPYYMSPEVYLGRFTEKCDVWSCGVILYFLITGNKPFTGDTKAELRNMVLQAEPSFAHPYFSKFSPNCKSLIQRMLTKGEEGRPSAKEALEDPWFHEEHSANDSTAIPNLYVDCSGDSKSNLKIDLEKSI